jgi:hypothetical protein
MRRFLHPMSGKFRIKTVYCEGEAKIEPFEKVAAACRNPGKLRRKTCGSNPY